MRNLLKPFCLCIGGYLLCSFLLLHYHLVKLQFSEGNFFTHNFDNSELKIICEHKYTVDFGNTWREVKVVNHPRIPSPSFVLLSRKGHSEFRYGIALTRAPEDPIEIRIIENDCYLNISKKILRITRDNGWATTRLIDVLKSRKGPCNRSSLAHVVRSVKGEARKMSDANSLLAQTNDEFVVLLRFGGEISSEALLSSSTSDAPEESKKEIQAVQEEMGSSYADMPITYIQAESNNSDISAMRTEIDVTNSTATNELVEGLKVEAKRSSGNWFLEPKFSKFLKAYSCTRIRKTRSYSIIQCVVASGKPEQTKFYIIGSFRRKNERTAVILGGVHGTERAGMLAASHIRKHWHPSNDILVILPIANTCGAHRHSRYSSCSVPVKKNDFATRNNDATSRIDDLNRNFPLNTVPTTELAEELWRLLSTLRPMLFLDLHEGWGYYAQLKDNFHDRLVGSNNFSKGSSVIASENALSVAEEMARQINKGIISKSHKFLVNTPPIEGGLALRLFREYGTISLVLETTIKNQPLEVRASQHLILVAKALQYYNFLQDDFKVEKISSHSAALFINVLQSIGISRHHKSGTKKSVNGNIA